MAHLGSLATQSHHSGSVASPLAAAGSAMLAIVFGILLLYGAGLAQPQAIHDAAHDSRHGLAFPCH